MSRERRSTIGVCPRCGDQLDLGALTGAEPAVGAPAAASGLSVLDHRLAIAAGAGGPRVDERAPPPCPACHVHLDVVDVVL